MCPDSAITKSMQVKLTKCTYVVNYGVAPELRSRLLVDIRDEPALSLLLDESTVVGHTKYLEIHVSTTGTYNVQVSHLKRVERKGGKAEHILSAVLSVLEISELNVTN
jgi:hypothetical protein